MELTELLLKVRNGDDQALHVLIPLVYKELKALAAGHLGRGNRGCCSGQRPASTKLEGQIFCAERMNLLKTLRLKINTS